MVTIATPTPTKPKPATKLTLDDIGRGKRFSRKGIARDTGVDISWISYILSPKSPRAFGSLRLMADIAAVLGMSMDEFLTFLREECGKDI